MNGDSSNEHLKSPGDDLEKQSECALEDESQNDVRDADPAREQDVDEKQDPSDNLVQEDSVKDDGPQYTVIKEREKRFVMVVASFASMISPFSSSIYYPAVNILAKDLNTSVSLINLSITTYLIFQGIAPSFTAALSETYGRRPAYIFCFTLTLAANIGLATQNSYAALLILRCLQSAGSSGTVALGSGVVSDLSTRAERGKYNVYINLGSTLGPSLAPVAGGLLSQYLGWRSIFWFLLILGSVLFLLVGCFLRETNRTIVGNGSVPPQRWNRSILQVILDKRRGHPEFTPDESTLEKGKRRINPLTSVKVLMEKENFLLIAYVSILFASYISVTSILSSQIHLRYGFDEVKVGLCYLPLGLGSLTSRWTIGYLVDWNFRREAKKQGLTIVRNRQQDIANFNVEIARLQIALPMTALAGCCILAYGWAMEERAPLAVILVILFLIGNIVAGGFVSVGALVMDINRQRPASAAAAANLTRCLLAAGAVALATPLIDAIGIGWTSSLAVLIWVVFSPMMVWVYLRGYQWRKDKAATLAKQQQERLGVATTVDGTVPATAVA